VQVIATPNRYWVEVSERLLVVCW